MRNQLESDHSFTNANKTQTDYFPSGDSVQKVCKSNSYSPSKKRLNKINKRAPYQNKDDPFFYERSSTMITDSNQKKELSLSMVPSKKNKRQGKLIIDKDNQVNKSLVKPSQFKRRVMTGSNNNQAQGTTNYKSKVKKRLKFTMRNNKAISSKMQVKKKDWDLSFKVQGLSGFLNTSNEIYNDGKAWVINLRRYFNQDHHHQAFECNKE